MYFLIGFFFFGIQMSFSLVFFIMCSAPIAGGTLLFPSFDFLLLIAKLTGFYPIKRTGFEEDFFRNCMHMHVLGPVARETLFFARLGIWTGELLLQIVLCICVFSFPE